MESILVHLGVDLGGFVDHVAHAYVATEGYVVVLEERSAYTDSPFAVNPVETSLVIY